MAIDEDKQKAISLAIKQIDKVLVRGVGAPWG